jgi:hypothetical protein
MADGDGRYANYDGEANFDGLPAIQTHKPMMMLCRLLALQRLV